MTVQSEKPESQFIYVIVAARRSRQLMAGARPLLENIRSRKATRIAMEELEHGLLEYEMPERPDAEERDGKRKK